MEIEKLSAGIAKFSAEFCKEVEGSGSAVSSPLSAELVLALLALGARGRAHDQILSSLHLPSDDFIRTAFKEVAARLTSVQGVTFNIANKLYLKEGAYELVPQFSKDAAQVFHADVEKMNFDNGSVAAAAINQWVESKTNNRIKDLLSSDSINCDTRIVLVNALYFKGSWKEQFNPAHTLDLPFHVDSKKTIKVPTMSLEKKFKYGQSKELDAQLLEMEYEGGEASMLVVLPNQVEGLPALLEKLAGGADLEAEAAKMYQTKVKLQLPKFKIETEIDLKVLLPKLGITAIFDQNNDELMGLLDNSPPLFVSHAVQKAFIEVNEEGAEAAAATAFGVMMMSAMVEPDPVSFVADRPFLCAVRVGSALAFWAAVREDFNQ